MPAGFESMGNQPAPESERAMFEHQQIVIKSGEGKNYFEASASLDTMATDSQTKIVMDALKQMQRERMEWAAAQKEAPLGQRQVAER
jgi:hypothetical protein